MGESTDDECVLGGLRGRFVNGTACDLTERFLTAYG
jgi:hypothetical protein